MNKRLVLYFSVVSEECWNLLDVLIPVLKNDELSPLRDRCDL